MEPLCVTFWGAIKFIDRESKLTHVSNDISFLCSLIFCWWSWLLQIKVCTVFLTCLFTRRRPVTPISALSSHTLLWLSCRLSPLPFGLLPVVPSVPSVTPTSIFVWLVVALYPQVPSPPWLLQTCVSCQKFDPTPMVTSPASPATVMDNIFFMSKIIVECLPRSCPSLKHPYNRSIPQGY